ncbi:MAG: glycerophosphodiester phosphodiesterase [Candidatus Hermodarchaeota archaeon]
MRKSFFYIGHRGTRIDYDENTLEAFEIALKSGANYIEFDVRKTKDNKLVVFHDSKVDRITSESGFITNFSYQEIAKIRFKLTDSHIPTIDEVLDKFKSRIKFIIELKSNYIGEAVLKAIDLHQLADDCIFSGRNLRELKLIKKRNPRVCVCYNITKGKGLNLKEFLKQARESSLHFKPDLINLHSKMISKDFIDICHKNQILTLCWDFLEYNKPFEVIKGLIDDGIDGVLFDNYRHIELTKKWIEKLNQVS